MLLSHSPPPSLKPPLDRPLSLPLTRHPLSVPLTLVQIARYKTIFFPLDGESAQVAVGNLPACLLLQSLHSEYCYIGLCNTTDDQEVMMLLYMPYVSACSGDKCRGVGAHRGRREKLVKGNHQKIVWKYVRVFFVLQRSH